MSCKAVDVKAWMLGEVDRREKGMYEQHLAQCQECRVELDRLRLTRTALLTLPDEEPPRRIAFVSDRVFEPRWWQRMWQSGPAMGFASAALLAGAILVHGFTRPIPVVTAPSPVAQVDTARIERRVNAAVAQAVAEIERRDDAKHREILAAAESKSALQGQALAAAQETIRLYQNQMGRLMVAANMSESRGAQ